MANLSCIRCDYDMEGVLAPVCPECGAAFGATEREAARLRARLVESRNKTRNRVASALGGAIVISALGLVVLDQHKIGTAAVGLVLCSIAAIGAHAAGWVAMRTLPAQDREPMRCLWATHVLRLHAPWLMIPVLTLGFGVIALSARLIAKAGTGTLISNEMPNLLMFIATCGLIAWAIFSLWHLMLWASQMWESMLGIMAAKPAVARRRVFVAGIVVFLGALGLGLGGGAMGTNLVLLLATDGTVSLGDVK